MLLARHRTTHFESGSERLHYSSSTSQKTCRAARTDSRRAQRRVASAVGGTAAEAAIADPSKDQGQQVAGDKLQQSADLEPSKQLSLVFSTANIPHPDKSSYGGEDAYFTSSVGGGAFGIADGVGGWADSGINPAEYSRTFMYLACAYLEGKKVQTMTAKQLNQAAFDNPGGDCALPADASLKDEPPVESAGRPASMKTLTPKGALTAAHTGTRLPGSTTACVLRLDRTKNSISAANLGDSGFLIIREGAVVFRSPALQHFFDCPLQFAAYPDYTNATDTSDDAAVYELPAHPGDIIVAATDGLWDNMPQEEILSVTPTSEEQRKTAAETIAKLASEHAHDRKFPSPYSQEAIKQGIDIPWFLKIANASFSDGRFRLGHMRGGKVDDITVVIAYVVEETFTPEAALDLASGTVSS